MTQCAFCGQFFGEDLFTHQCSGLQSISNRLDYYREIEDELWNRNKEANEAADLHNSDRS